MHVKFAATVIAGFLATGIAFAQSKSGLSPDRAARMDRHFSYTDKDGNGFIERAEVAPYPVLIKHFAIIDFDNDNRLSKEEMRAYRMGTARKRNAATAKKKFKAPGENDAAALTKADDDDSSGSRKNN